MFRPIRRTTKALSNEEAWEILNQGNCCVLALDGDEGYPYAVAVNYIVENGKLYFHSAPEGHKPEAIARNNKCSFLVIAQDTLLPEKFTTNYRSVHGFGRVQEVRDTTQRRQHLLKVVARLAPGHADQDVDAYIDARFDRVKAYEITIEHLSGKQGYRETGNGRQEKA